jgi:hypothetical protein
MTRRGVNPWSLASLLLGVLAAAPAAGARVPTDEVLRVRLGMPKQEALERLGKVGRKTSDRAGPSGSKQQWALSDRRYANLMIAFDPQERVHWISLFARKDGRVVRFRDLGDLARAQRRGNYIYFWSVPARGGRGAYQVIARSVDPDRVESLSLVRLSSVIVDGVAGVRMERSGRGNGRVYTVSFIAESGTGRCEGSVQVCVPHDQGGGTPCVDDGQDYVSTVA